MNGPSSAGPYDACMRRATRSSGAPAASGQWSSWSGLASSSPTRVLTPGTTDEVAGLVADAARQGVRLKMVGAGHSFTDVAVTDGWLLRPDRLVGVVDVDRVAMTV